MRIDFYTRTYGSYCCGCSYFRGEVLAWLSIWSEVQMICIYGPADVTATLSSLAPVKSRMVYLSVAGLLRLSWKKIH